MCLALRLAQLEKEMAGISKRMLSSTAKDSMPQPLHCQGSRDRGAEWGETASVFSPKVLLTHFLLAGGGKNLQLKGLSKNVPWAHRWVSSFQEATPIPKHMTCPPWDWLKMGPSDGSSDKGLASGHWRVLTPDFHIALALSLIAMAQLTPH